MIDTDSWLDYLLTDDEMADFIIDGYKILDAGVEESLNASIMERLNELETNPGDGVIELVPGLKDIYDSPRVRGALASLLGTDYSINDHLHCHRNPSGSRSQGWHQDNISVGKYPPRHDQHINQILMMYYPQDVRMDNGPTALIPGSHLLSNQSRDLTASQGNFKYQVTARMPAGYVLFTHYDIWHAGTANTSGNVRYMIKFVFDRNSQPSRPSWKHNPNRITEVLHKLDSEPVKGLQWLLAAKVKINRREMFNNLAGNKLAKQEYYDQFTGNWPVAPA